MLKFLFLRLMKYAYTLKFLWHVQRISKETRNINARFCQPLINHTAFLGRAKFNWNKVLSQFWSHAHKKRKRIDGMKAMHELSIVYCLRERVIKVPILLFVCLLNLSTILSFCMRKILGYIKGNFHGIYRAKTVSFIRYRDYCFF